MNCETMKNQVLLDQSGEISWWSRRRMNAHLAACADCRAFRDDLRRLTDAVHSVRWDEGFAPPLARRITAVAPRRERTPAVSWQPAFAYAALSVLLALAFVLVLRPFHRPVEIARATSDTAVEFAWDADLDDRIATLDSLLNRADTDWSDTGTTATDNGDVDSIAQQLLALEGEQI